MDLNLVYFIFVVIISVICYIFAFFRLGRNYTKAFLFTNFTEIKRVAFILSAFFFFTTYTFSLLLIFRDAASCEVTHPIVLDLFRQIDDLLNEQMSSEDFNKLRTSHKEYLLCFTENIFTEAFRLAVDEYAWLSNDVCPTTICTDVCPLEQKITLKIYNMCIEELFIKPNIHIYGNRFACDPCKILIDKEQTVRFVQFTCFFELINMMESQEYNFRRLCLDPIIPHDLQAKKFCEFTKHAWVLEGLSPNLPEGHRKNADFLLEETLKMVSIFESCHGFFCGFVYDTIGASKSFYLTRGHLPPHECQVFANEAISLLPSHAKNPPQLMSELLRDTSFPFFRKNGMRTLCDNHYQNLTLPPINEGTEGSSSKNWAKIFGKGLL